MSDELSKKLNYTFQDPAYLKMALTHRSKGGMHNERLEFLGDSVVNFVIAEALYQQFPKATEGELSRFRASLVSRDALAELAKQFQLGKYVILGPGELRSGGHERQSILSCTMEAVIGAIYCDAGFAIVHDRILAWYADSLASLSDAGLHKDPKTRLQEYLQSRRLGLPAYSVAAIEGEAHQQHFTIKCEVTELASVTFGKGTSRRKAEQAAAVAMLKVLKT